MLIKNKIIRDTVMLTALQLFLDSSSLLLNAFITRRLGTSAMGILSLTGSFLVLAGTVSNGNAFLCMSRLISEELGKSRRNPNRVLAYGLVLCTMLSTAVSIALLGFSDIIGIKFLKSEAMSKAVRLMPLALIPGAFSACFKGYFNAMRSAKITAAGDILEFAVKSAVIAALTVGAKSSSDGSVCTMMICGIVSGACCSLVYFLIMFVKFHGVYGSKPSISFGKYISLAIPIMLGSVITSALSSTNDALIPITLRQYGDSVNEALGSFGIFEAIVIPTIFFPSVVLCSMSGIIVSEAARASASGNKTRIKSISEKLIEATLIFAFFAAAVLMKFGCEIGELLGGGQLAGKIISIIAPVVPFIYLEIVLEALIKGLGLQGFSSLNYFIEYAVRISIVLIFVPKFGFYGIVASYYASNVIGNCSRVIKILRHTGVKLRPIKSVIMPIVYVFLTMNAAELLLRIFGIGTKSIPGMIIFALIWGVGYTAIFLFEKDIIVSIPKSALKSRSSFVKNKQKRKAIVL